MTPCMLSLLESTQFHNPNGVVLATLIQLINRRLFDISEIACVSRSLFEASIGTYGICSSDEYHLMHIYGFYMGNAKNGGKYILISNDSQLFSACGLLLHRISSRHLKPSVKHAILIASFLILCIQPNAVKVYQHIFKLIIHGAVKLLVKVHHVINVIVSYYPKNAHVWILKEVLLHRAVKMVRKNPFFPTLRLRWLIINDLKLNCANPDAKLYRKIAQSLSIMLPIACGFNV
ncbi:hypothetical protein BMR1_02g02230 [Babesia microti strain RI]|uniref:Uncharacterized protein n=1 Tax=Babesia microti (strain RI) TaxID=1133968 RepID=I7JA41_BABMR|nr:hypothetical protein BMR1_02g02230 [Babesia microti strain RI]CCF73604.1 hypothetical protein BMR1_02g02230 [Babesia microti strain RI]|eukprot:XP_012648213.1 hypothetical protein BMR1_02g02230 [Babesia microti strain RI]